jgi:ABC-type glycerol-3-phosphate transport system substrate-binding protein
MMRNKIWRGLTFTMIVAFAMTACTTQQLTPNPITATPPELPTITPVAPASPANDSASVDSVGPVQISVMHYFNSESDKHVLTRIFSDFGNSNPLNPAVDVTPGRGDFKAQVQLMMAGDNPPDLVTYQSGYLTQLVVNNNKLTDLTKFWSDNQLDKVITTSVKPASIYNGKVYVIPQDVYVAGFYYNPKVFARAGIATPPKSWNEFLYDCSRLRSSGTSPIALGAKNRWPVQYWFDYLLAYTAGMDYRQKLMTGNASYSDQQVVNVIQIFINMLSNGYFVKTTNAFSWSDAADQVAKGQAAMTLMDSRVVNYWNRNGLKSGADYDFFPFPQINPKLPVVAFGSADGWVVPASAKDPAGAEKFILAMLSPTNQAAFAKAQSALAAAGGVPAGSYDPVMQKSADYLAKAQFYNEYQLSTTTAMAEGGLNMFAQIISNPVNYMIYINQTTQLAKEIFK